MFLFVNIAIAFNVTWLLLQCTAMVPLRIRTYCTSVRTLRSRILLLRHCLYLQFCEMFVTDWASGAQHTFFKSLFFWGWFINMYILLLSLAFSSWVVSREMERWLLPRLKSKVHYEGSKATHKLLILRQKIGERKKERKVATGSTERVELTVWGFFCCL